jgi:hypothetical protein
MRKTCTLWAPRRSTCKQQHRGIIFIDRNIWKRWVICARRTQQVVKFRKVMNLDISGKTGFKETLHPWAIGENQAGFRKFHSVKQLGWSPPTIETRNDCATGERRPPTDDIRSNVRRSKRDTVTLDDTTLGKPCRYTGSRSLNIVETQRDFGEHKVGEIAMTGGKYGHYFADVA